ncbi:MAG: hypothetical protein ABIF19_13090, partial [Planctomycetota bacterium]
MNEAGLSRREFLHNSSLTAAGTIAGAIAAAQARGADESVQAVIQRAGNADSDRVRLDLLKRLYERPGLDASVKRDLAELIA